MPVLHIRYANVFARCFCNVAEWMELTDVDAALLRCAQLAMMGMTHSPSFAFWKQEGER
jgi:hypothetical protein